MRSVSLLQRKLEELGIATISICNQPAVSEKVCVPRAAFIQYPFGRILGDVGDRAGQRAVCDDVCAHLEAARGPNAYRHLPHAWHEPPEEAQWKPLQPAPMHVLRNKGTAPKGLAHYQDDERPDLA